MQTHYFVIKPHRYCALGAEISSDLVLPELQPSDPISEGLVQIQQGDHKQWPNIEPSPHSTPTLQLAPQDWRLELEGIGWFRATGGERLEWQRWDDSVSDRDIRTFAVTSGLEPWRSSAVHWFCTEQRWSAMVRPSSC